MEYTFDTILRSIREWAGHVPFPAEILRDDGGGYRIIWQTPNHMAELIVCRGEYAPYRFVSFQILDLQPEPVYCYFDREDSSLSEIRTALDEGIGIMKEGWIHHA